MTQRVLWGVSVPLAVLAWAGLAVFTAVVPPSPLAYAGAVPLAGLALAMTVAVPLWLLARWLRVPGTGERPALALRAAGWIGLWGASCLALKLAGYFLWLVAMVLAVVLLLIESFLLQHK